MKNWIVVSLVLLPLTLQAKDLTNCVVQGGRTTCLTETLEEANTPLDYNKMGSAEWCLVSKVPITKYSCSFSSIASCQAAANIDNTGKAIPVSSCIRNNIYR